jgi:uncharacterized protein YlxW (UPF0749 family)
VKIIRVKSELSAIIQKEQTEHNRQIKELENKLLASEEDTRGLQNKIQDQIHRLQVLRGFK